jgi:hypothetical protein
MTRRIITCAVAAALASLCLASAASATPAQLLLSQSAAFSLLGHSCGGIQERVYATGFAADGYPTGNVYMQTRCGGSGRGGGYEVTTYSAWASVRWSWFGETRSFARREGAAEENTSFSAEDAHGDRIYNSGSAAYLETGEPPLQPPAAPGGLGASVALFEAGEVEYLRMQVSWSPAAETAGLISSSTVTATPVEPGPPVLSARVEGSATSAYLSPVSPNTSYRVTVTSTDAEGTSEASSPIEVTSPNEDGGGGAPGAEICEQNSGSIKLTPGLSETPHVQEIALKGSLKLCDGPAEPTEATYVAHLLTTEEVTCSTLDSLSVEPTTSAVSFAVKWLPLGSGKSVGQLLVPLTEAGGDFHGELEGGPFAGPRSVFASSLWESFKGAATCGVPSPKGVVKPVKSGTFATSAVEIG